MSNVLQVICKFICYIFLYVGIDNEQERIDQAEKLALRDGRITRMEQEKLTWMQKKACENIYEAMNNRHARDAQDKNRNNHFKD